MNVNNDRCLEMQHRCQPATASDPINVLQSVTQERGQLAAQVQHLVRVERSMLEVQDRLDQQVKLYQELNEIAKQLNTTFDSREILAMAQEFLLYGLNFERCAVLPINADVHCKTTSPVAPLLWDGYDDAPISPAVAIDQAFWGQLGAQDYVMSCADQPVAIDLGAKLGLDEWIACAIRAQADAPPDYLIIVGNTRDRAKLFSRVTPEAEYEVVLNNLLAQVCGAIGQAQLYQSSLDQATKLQNALNKLKSTQAQLIQTEKLSSLGELVAGIAHEINNPVNFLQGNLTYAQTYADGLLKLVELYQNADGETSPQIQAMLTEIDFDFLHRDFPQVLNSMTGGAQRIQEIVVSLRNFSRIDASEFKPVDLHEGLESTLLILQHRFSVTRERPDIKLTKQYGDIALVQCAAGLINQVFMNLISNAIDALTEAYNLGKLSDLLAIELCTAPAACPESGADGVMVRIIDNGPGIPEHVQARLFDPFFTTKPVGKGTGLGLSISHQIMTEKHHGTLRCRSTPGQGTEFQVWLPCRHGATEQPIVDSDSV